MVSQHAARLGMGVGEHREERKRECTELLSSGRRINSLIKLRPRRTIWRVWRKSGIRDKIGAQQQEIVRQRSGPEGRAEDGGLGRPGWHGGGEGEKGEGCAALNHSPAESKPPRIHQNLPWQPKYLPKTM